MRPYFMATLCATAAFFLRPQALLAVAINMVPVGSPGNAPDPLTGVGEVDYSYQIAANDVTNTQYVEFLNDKDPTGANALGLYYTHDPIITLNKFASVGSKYSVNLATYNNWPVTYVNWFSAVRFANWMSNGQGNGDTEAGSYLLLHTGSANPTPIPSNASSVTRNAGATYVLPSLNEWYKGAYYDSRTTAQGGPTNDSHYWLFATSSNSSPTPSHPTSLANHVNAESKVATPTNVGAYTGTTSPVGAYDMGGNVSQMTETNLVGTNWGSPVEFAESINTVSDFYQPVQPNIQQGFRLAMVPEPSARLLSALGLLVSIPAFRRLVSR